VLLAPDEQDQQTETFRLFAPIAKLDGAVEKANLKMTFYQGVAYTGSVHGMSSVLKFQKMEVDLFQIFQSRILGSPGLRGDYRNATGQKLFAYVKELKDNPSHPSYGDHFLRASYLFYSRIFNPFLVFAFFLFGVVFGIRNPRHSSQAGGFPQGIGMIIVSFVLVLCGKVAVENSLGNPILDGFIPVLVILAASFGIFIRRSHLPLGESLWTLPRRRPLNQNLNELHPPLRNLKD
jgi:lipopolysaccharide export LptBFGC system permease protein LptF